MELEQAEKLADELIAAEIGKQDQMWGRLNERADTKRGQLLKAGIASAIATNWRINGYPKAFQEVPAIYPSDWSGFRDYGSDIANIVVAISFLRQEVKRKLMNGEDYTRTSRRPDQPYNPDSGLPKEI